MASNTLLKYSRAGLIGILFLMSILTPLLLAANASGAPGDYKVEVIMTSTTSRTVEAGKTTIYTCTIKNVGLFDDRYWINTTCVAGDQYYDAGWRAVVSQNKTNLLSPGSSFAMSVTVTVPVDAEYPTVASITIIAESSYSTSSGSNLTLTSVKAVWDVGLTKDVPKLDLPGQSIEYSGMVVNEGTIADSYVLQVTDWPTGWDKPVLTYSKALIDPKDNITFDVTVTIPADAENASYHIQIEAVSDANGSIGAQVVLTTHVGLVLGVDLDVALPSYLEMVPEQTIHFNVTVTNTGNAPNEIAIQYNLNLTKYEIYGKDSSGLLQIDEQYEFTVTLKSLVDPTPGKDNLIITAISSDDLFVPLAQESETIVLDMAPVWAIDIEPVAASVPTLGEVENGFRNVVFNLEVENTGTIQSGQVVFEILDGPHSNYADIQAEVIDLAPKEKAGFNVTVQIPEGFAPGEYYFTVKAAILGDADNFGESTYHDNATLTVVVTERNEFEFELVSPWTGVQNVIPGEMVSFNVSLQNFGNVQDTYALSVLNDPNGWCTLDKYEVTLEPIQTAEVEWFVTPNNKAVNSPAGNHTFTIMAKSKNTKSEMSIQTTTIVERVTDILLNYTTGVSQKDAKPGEAVEFWITVANMGNFNESYSLSMISEANSWITISNADMNFYLLPKESRNVRVIIDVPDVGSLDDLEDVMEGLYSFKVKVASNDNLSASAETALHVYIVQIFEIDLLPIQDKIEVNANSINGSKFGISIQNLGNSQDIIRLEVSPETIIGANIKFSKSLVTLAVSEKKTVFVTVTLDKSFKYHSLSFDITATPDNGQNTELQKTLAYGLTSKGDDVDVVLNKGDLSISSVSDNIQPDLDGYIFVKKGDDVDFSIVVANDGTEDVSSILVTVKANDVQIGSTRISRLNAGQSITVTIPTEIRSNGDQIIVVEVDPDNDIMENDEGDNAYPQFVLDYEEKEDTDDGDDDSTETFGNAALCCLIVPIIFIILIVVFILVLVGFMRDSKDLKKRSYQKNYQKPYRPPRTVVERPKKEAPKKPKKEAPKKSKKEVPKKDKPKKEVPKKETKTGSKTVTIKKKDKTEDGEKTVLLGSAPEEE